MKYRILYDMILFAYLKYLRIIGHHMHASHNTDGNSGNIEHRYNQSGSMTYLGIALALSGLGRKGTG